MILAQNDIHLWLSPYSKGLKTEDFLREVLSNYLPLAPPQIRFARSINGKPYLKDRRFKQLQFNISHSHGKIVCAVTTGLLLGVDIENTQRKNSIEEIAERYFHADEVKQLQSIQNADEKCRLFFTFWTCKEAYIKALGKTIGTLSLDSIPFVYNKGLVSGAFPLPAQQQWSFQVTSQDNFLIAVAHAQRPWQSGKPELTLFDAGI